MGTIGLAKCSLKPKSIKRCCSLIKTCAVIAITGKSTKLTLTSGSWLAIFRMCLIAVMLLILNQIVANFIPSGLVGRSRQFATVKASGVSNSSIIC